MYRYGQVFGTYFGTKPILNTSVVEHIKTVLGDLKTFPNESTVEFNDKYLTHSMVSSSLTESFLVFKQ